MNLCQSRLAKSVLAREGFWEKLVKIELEKDLRKFVYKAALANDHSAVRQRRLFVRTDETARSLPMIGTIDGAPVATGGRRLGFNAIAPVFLGAIERPIGAR